MRNGSQHAGAWEARPADGGPGGSMNASLPPAGADAMNGGTMRRRVVVTNPQGLHMRPASLFAECARQFQSTVTVTRDGQGVDGKSVLSLLLLMALPGTELVVEVSGPDAEAALPVLAELLASPDPEPPLPPKG
jgi:phosphotransferase system HPr (HPr) family protein